jgi:hypothetical protein
LVSKVVSADFYHNDGRNYGGLDKELENKFRRLEGKKVRVKGEEAFVLCYSCPKHYSKQLCGGPCCRCNPYHKEGAFIVRDIEEIGANDQGKIDEQDKKWIKEGKCKSCPECNCALGEACDRCKKVSRCKHMGLCLQCAKQLGICEYCQCKKGDDTQEPDRAKARVEYAWFYIGALAHGNAEFRRCSAFALGQVAKGLKGKEKEEALQAIETALKGEEDKTITSLLDQAIAVLKAPKQGAIREEDKRWIKEGACDCGLVRSVSRPSQKDWEGILCERCKERRYFNASDKLCQTCAGELGICAHCQRKVEEKK